MILRRCPGPRPATGRPAATRLGTDPLADSRWLARSAGMIDSDFTREPFAAKVEGDGANGLLDPDRRAVVRLRLRGQPRGTRSFELDQGSCV